MKGFKYGLYVILMLGLTGLLMVFSERSILLFLDIPSFVFLLAAFLIYTFTVVGFRATGSYFAEVFTKEETRLTEKASRYFGNLIPFFATCGFVGFIAGVIMVLADISDKDAIGPNLAVALIVPLYAVLLILLVAVPFRVILNRKGRIS